MAWFDKRDSNRQKPPSLSQWLEFIGELEAGRPIAITCRLNSKMACGRSGKLKRASADARVPKGWMMSNLVGASREDQFSEWFEIATHGFTPYRWQVEVALNGLPDVLPIPTGLGKTEVVLAWAWRLLVDKKSEPLHLVVEAAGLYDLGKTHPQWQSALPDCSGIPDALLAKSPRVMPSLLPKAPIR
ncbi:MAG: hypothetical protein IRZ28_18310 [Steroidobacteraceae bacterium]|nr:hypothetical protein [Steroidobacteraceae bacterium]